MNSRNKAAVENGGKAFTLYRTFTTKARKLLTVFSFRTSERANLFPCSNARLGTPTMTPFDDFAYLVNSVLLGEHPVRIFL